MNSRKPRSNGLLAEKTFGPLAVERRHAGKPCQDLLSEPLSRVTSVPYVELRSGWIHIYGLYNMSDIKYAPAPTEPPPSYETAAQPKSHGTATKTPPVKLPLPLDLPTLNAVRDRRVILASASPRRRQLLAQVSHAAPFSLHILHSQLTITRR